MGALLAAGCAPIETYPNRPSSAPVASDENDNPEGFGGPESQSGTIAPPSVSDLRHLWDAAFDRESATLWSRIRRGFRLTDREHWLAREYSQWYASHPRHLDQVMEQAEPYLYLVVEAVEERGIPTEIALLPMVESAYNPFANSPSHAAGLWQFLPSTGDAYGLKRNSWYDGRRDIVESTRAALDYLQKLNDEFNGDWLLAIAAYNAGEGTVMRAVEKNRQNGRRVDFWSLDLPAVTQAYVPKLLGIATLVENPDQFGVALKPIPNRPLVQEIHLNSQVSLAHAARAADLSLDMIRQLNPCYKRSATDPQGPHRLLLPVSSADLFKERFVATASASAATDREPGDLVHEGEALTGLPERRGAGQLVHIAGRDGGLAGSQDDSGPKTGGRTDLYTVASGETLWSIARDQGVAVKELLRWNGLRASEALKAGQRLAVRQPSGSAELASNSDAPPDSLLSYKVRPGDTLWSVARRFQVDVGSLRRWNRVRVGVTLQPGQSLRVYVDPATLTGG
jgi:membrane-bound lytic murein transglycosylase D